MMTETEQDYTDLKNELRSEIEEVRDERPRDSDALWGFAYRNARWAYDWMIEIRPPSEQDIQDAKRRVLKALVALEMAEERLEQEGSE